MRELRSRVTTMEVERRQQEGESRAETESDWGICRWGRRRRDIPGVWTASNGWKQRAAERLRRRSSGGGALMMQPLMPPGWTPPTGPPQGAPQDKDADMTETVGVEPEGGAEKDAAEGAGDAGDAGEDGNGE